MTTAMSLKSAPNDAVEETLKAPDEKTFWRKMKTRSEKRVKSLL